MANILKVFVLNTGANASAVRRVFYSESLEGEGERAPVRYRGLRGWAEAKLGRLKERWQHSQGGAARLTRGAWDWLQRRTHPDETLLARLRGAESIEVLHPPSMSGDEVATAWSGFLAASRRRHWPWFLVDVVVAPLTVVLAPLPGPNLIGYWFAYRAVHHGLILTGLSRVRKGNVATRFQPAEALEIPVSADSTHVEALGCDPEALGGYLERQGVRPVRGGEG